MSRDKRLNIRVSEKEFDRLQQYADQQSVSMAELVRDWIKSLPIVETKAL